MRRRSHTLRRRYGHAGPRWTQTYKSAHFTKWRAAMLSNGAEGYEIDRVAGPSRGRDRFFLEFWDNPGSGGFDVHKLGDFSTRGDAERAARAHWQARQRARHLP